MGTSEEKFIPGQGKVKMYMVSQIDRRRLNAVTK